MQPPCKYPHREPLGRTEGEVPLRHADYGETDLAAEFQERYMGEVTDRHEQRAAATRLPAS